jgi:hypothetical protein
MEGLDQIARIVQRLYDGMDRGERDHERQFLATQTPWSSTRINAIRHRSSLL